MKKYILPALALALFFTGCNEKQFLEEVPLDFMSTSNSFKTETDFNMATNDLYYYTRYEFYGYNEYRPFDYIYATDLVWDGEPGGIEKNGNMASAYNVTSHIPKVHWDNFYKLISSSNAIISRVKTTSFSDDVKKSFEAKARFFRGLSYRSLVYMFGGVPVVTEELTSPKTDFVRETKEKTLDQAISDVLFAAENLPDITKVKDGEVSSTAAYHLLAELYLAKGEYDKAVKAADKVIDNPAMSLMTERFGSRKNVTPGDVYWDLFRMNNQNRASGNTEAIWVIQYETDLPGGGSSTVTAKTTGNFCQERNVAPMFNKTTLTIEGKKYTPFNKWPCSDLTGGRGIGWAISTKFFSNTVWEDDFTGDMRNANHNFARVFPVHNEDLIKMGITEIDVDNPPAGLYAGGPFNGEVPARGLYAYQTKCTTPGNHPDALYSNKEKGQLKSTAGATYTDQYMFRLAETYLLRAEAYLGLKNKAKALADINVIRNRAHAKPATEGQITLDYILDERVRELGIEEKRRLTLMRLGKLYDRVMKYNPYFADPKTCGDGVGMLEKYNLWPIPQSAIEANKDAVLEQNPGY